MSVAITTRSRCSSRSDLSFFCTAIRASYEGMPYLDTVNWARRRWRTALSGSLCFVKKARITH